MEKSTCSTLTGEKVKTKKKHEIIIIHAGTAKEASDVGVGTGKGTSRVACKDGKKHENVT